MSLLTRRQVLASAAASALPARPNILWLTAEDMGHQLGCYGHPLVRTPHIDRLASQGTRFTNAFTTAPVCSASRSGFNTGMYQTSIDAQNHRSHRKDGYKLPDGVKLISTRLQEQGYFTANVRDVIPKVGGTGKTDFNFNVDHPYDGTHWNQRRPGQPFFAHINFQEPHKGPAFIAARKQKNLIDPKQAPLPPYFPDHPVVRDEIANFLDAINLLDKKIGVTLEALEKDGLMENTIIFFFGDNGTCLLRGKQWLYDKGIRVPMIARWPGQTKPGTVRDDLVSAIDMTASCLWAAGVTPPKEMHGRPLYGPMAQKRDVIFAARDRCDMTVDRIRCVRDHRYKYIRNFLPDRPYTQHNNYIETQYPTQQVMKDLFAQGKLNAVQSLFMQPRKPEVEFYDIVADPHEVRNLAGDSTYRKKMDGYEKQLRRWIEETHDKGAVLESPEVVAAES